MEFKRLDGEKETDENKEGDVGDSANQNKAKSTGGKKGETHLGNGGVKKTVTFDEKILRSEKAFYSVHSGSKRRRSHFCRGYHHYGEDDSDKENSHRGNRGYNHHHHNSHREHWDNGSSTGTTGDSGRMKMKSPRGAASWGGSEPKFVVPRIKSHLSPSAVKMKMRNNDLSSPLWAELVFSSDDEFDKVKTCITICCCKGKTS